MNFTVVGISYKKTSIETRELLFIDEQDYSPLLKRIYHQFQVKEVVLLSTCNRLEIYYINNQNFQPQDLFAEFLKYKSLQSENIPFYIHQKKEAYRHLFRVCSSLDSMVVGESQILGQVKQAWELSKKYGVIGYSLEFIFQKAFQIAKKIRTHTKIASQAVSIGSAAVDLASSIFDSLQEQKILVIGAGEMAELIICHLKKMGVHRIFVTNRNFKNSLKLVEQWKGSAVWYEERYDYLLESSIVISSTGAKNFVLEHHETNAVLQKKKNSTFFIDVAVPRDIDPEIHNIPNVYLYHIDDLQAVADVNLQNRQKEVTFADLLLEDGLSDFMDLLQWRKKSSLILALQKKQETVIKKELKSFFQKNPEFSKSESAIEGLVNKLNKKFLHDPHLFLKKGYSKDIELVFRDIFALKEENKYSKKTEKTEKFLHKQPKTIQLIKNE